MGPSSLNAQIFKGPRGALRAARYAGRATRAGVLVRTARYRYRWSDPTYETQPATAGVTNGQTTAFTTKL
eukprot:scaffold91639_cov62-Phaeocystis_antarctica.AAC.6